MKSKSAISLKKKDGVSEAEYGRETDLRRIGWETIIFLPFNKVFRMIVVLCILISVFSNSYRIGYENIDCNWSIALLIVVELIYALDSSLRFVHRIWKRVSSQRMYVSKHSFWFFVDVTSLVPLDFMLSTQVATNKAAWFKLNRLLRIHRLYAIFEDFSNDLSLNSVLFIYITHFFYLITICHLLSIVWHHLSCWKCPQKNWSQDLIFEFDALNIDNWYLICFILTVGLVTRNWRGMVRGESEVERYFMTLFMLVGMIFEYGACTGRLISVYMKQRQRQMEFELELEMIRRTLFLRDIDTETTANILQYYKFLWNRRLGFKSMPYITSLPLALQKKIKLDIHWDAFLHSHFIGDLDIAFRKTLCLHMKTDFFLPGEYVIKRGGILDHMIFIVSGVIQILSEEEGESAIFSFSGGTCIGEFCLLLPYASKIDLRSATFSEVQILNVRDLFTTCCIYPGVTSYLNNLFITRLETAKSKMQLKGINIDDDMAPKGADEIKWMKTRWKMAIENVEGEMSAQEEKEPIENPILLAQHTSEYLKTLVFSDKIELKTDAIFIKSSFPWVLNPDSSFLKYWNILVFVTDLFTFVLFPYFIAFQGHFTYRMEAMATYVTVIYATNLFIKSYTAIKTVTTIITAPGKIFLTKSKQFLFICDILAAIPIELPFKCFNADKLVLGFCRSNRLIKVFNIIHTFYSWGQKLNFKLVIIRILTYVFIYCSVVYLCSAIVYLSACPKGPNELCESFSWYAMGLFKEVETTKQVIRFKSAFVVSFSYAMSCIMKFGFSHEIPVSVTDIKILLGMMIIAYFLYGYFFSEFCALQMLIRKRSIDFKEIIVDLKDQLHACNVDVFTRERVFNYMYFQWDYNFASSVLLGEDNVFKHANPHAKKEVLEDTLENAISHIILFRDTDPGFLKAVVSHCKLYALGANAIVTEPSVRCTSLNVIRKGYCLLQSHLPGDLERRGQKVLGPGSHFPVVEFFHQIPSLVTVKTITHCEVVTIEYDHMSYVLRSYSHVDDEINDVLKEQDMLQNISKLKPSKQILLTIGRAEMYSISYLERDDEADLKEYIEHWKKLGSFSLIRFLFFRRTIDPTSKHLLWWEIARSIFAILNVICTPLAYSAMLNYFEYLRWFLLFLDCTSWVDLYLRMHIGYFNQKNILVRHCLYTAKYNFKHAFLTDLIATMPLTVWEELGKLLKVSSLYQTNLILTTISRCLQMYRFYKLCSFLESDALKDRRYLARIKYWVTALILINITACVTPAMYCQYKNQSNGTVVTDCKDEFSVFAEAKRFSNTENPIVMYVVALYYTVCLFTLNADGTLYPRTARAHVILCISAIIFFFLRAMFVAVVAGLTMLGNIRMTKYQERMKSLIRFLNLEGADHELEKLAINHFEFEWASSRGSFRHKLFSSLHPTLREAVCFSIFSKTLKKISIFRGADESFFRQVSMHLVEQFFVTGEMIIKSSDVIGEIYFTYKGSIESVDENEEKIFNLGPGSMFGNLCKTARRRLRINVLAKSNVSVLSIQTNQFYAIIRTYPAVAEKFRKEVLLHPEAIEIHTVSKGSEVSFETRSVVSFYKMKHKVSWWLTVHSNLYLAWTSFVCTVVPFLTVCIVILTLDHKLDDKTLIAMVILYILDFVYLVKIILCFNSPYLNKETGHYIFDYKAIAVRYLKMYDGFFLDIISLLPLEIIALLYEGDLQFLGRSWYYWLKCNRLLRLLVLILYFKTQFNRLNVNTFLRWLKVIMEQVLAIIIGGSAFTLFCCHGYFCKYRREVASESYDVITTLNGNEMSAAVGLFIVSLFSSSTFQLITPHSVTDMIVISIIMLIFQSCIAQLIGDMVSIITVKNYSRNEYESEIDILVSYARDMNLSPALQKKTQDYSDALWNTNSGESLPIFINKAPKSLREALNGDMYGQHLYRSHYFSGLHADLIRQLCGYLNRNVYFPGFLIVDKGDIDNCVYFIHDGEVDVVQTSEYIDNVIDVLKQNDVFGIKQGLLGNTPHTNQYRARTTVELLSLDRMNWEYLLDYFPDSKTEIYSRIQYREE